MHKATRIALWLAAAFVVIVTTIVSTVFFALMDRFWGFLTNLVYGGS